MAPTLFGLLMTQTIASMRSMAVPFALVSGSGLLVDNLLSRNDLQGTADFFPCLPKLGMTQSANRLPVLTPAGKIISPGTISLAR
jgi:hypothetical protein